MKTKLAASLVPFRAPLLLAWLVLTLIHQPSTACAQGTAFTYQGRLQDGAAPASGIYDLRFTIYDLPSGGAVQGGPLTNAATGVSNGLFTVTLNFGAGVFNGANRWVEIQARTNGNGAFTSLTPRQAITATPYAITASNLSGTLPATQLTGTLPNAQLSASVSLLGANIDSAEITDSTITTNDLNASVLNGTFWKLGGNAGANPTNGVFLGTTDNQPLEFKVNNQRGLRLEYAGLFDKSINVIGGYSGNSVGAEVVGATIAGGGMTNTSGFALPNTVTDNYGTVGGGSGNTASGGSATVSGGFGNTAEGLYTTVGGGAENFAGYSQATVGGGGGNIASNYSATIGGGEANVASGDYATIPGGYQNVATNRAFAAGFRAKANHPGAFVWADNQSADFASTGVNQFLIRASGGMAIGTNDPAGAALRVAGSIKADSFLGAGATLMLNASGGVGINTATPQGVFGVQVPLSQGSPGTVSLTGEDFAPALVMRGGPAPGILRLRNGLEVWPNTNGTSAGFLDVRNTSGTANIVLKGDNGRAGLGTTSPASRLHIKQSVDGGGLADSTGGIRLERAGTSAYWQIENWDDNDLIFRHNSGGAFFFIRDTDGTQAIASDKNLKKDIEPLTPMLDRVLALQPVSFRYKPVPETEPPTLGFVAQDVEKVLPNLVEQKGEHKMLTMGGLIPVSIAAIQELNQKVEAGSRRAEDKNRDLEERLQQKETEITELKQRLEKLEQLLTPKLAGAQ